MRGQLAIGVFYGEVLLVVAHDRYQDLFGELQIGGLEVAEQDVGPFGQVGYGVDERVIFAPAGVRDRAGYVVEGFADFLTADFDVGEDVLAL